MTKKVRVDRGIYKLGDGLYEIAISAGKDPATGKYRQVFRRHRGTLTSARDFRRQLLTDRADGKFSVSNRTVDELLDLWLADCETIGLAPKTIKEYRADADRYWRPAIGKKQVHKVELADLRRVITPMIERDLSRETIRHVRACISSAFTWARTEGWITTDPTKALKIPRGTATRPTVAAPAEVKTLLAAARASGLVQLERVIWLGAITGARNSEIRALRHGDIDPAAGVLGVERALSAEQVWTTKNRQIRDVSLDQLTVNVVLEQIRFMEARAGHALPSTAFLFSDDPLGQRPWREEQITRPFSKLADANGCAHLTFKHLRKFMSTYGRELGFTSEDVADRAGHDVAVAEKHYRGSVKSSRDQELSAGLAGLITATE